MKWIGLSALVLAVACGGSATPQKPVNVGQGSEGGAGGPGGQPDLSPVAAPDELFVVGRLSNPAKVMDKLAAWSKLPFDWRQLLAKEEPGLERVVHLDAPVEFAVALDPNAKGQLPEPLAVASIGLTSLDMAVEFARQKGESVRQVRAGVYRVGDTGECAIAAAVGTAPARLVCGDSAEDVDALLPYATRGLPTEQLGTADFHVELRAEPVRRRHGKELRQLKLLAPFAVRDLSIDNARFDRALKDAAAGLAEEVIAIAEDLDRISIDAWVKGDAIEATSTLKMRSSQSWTADTLAQAAKRSSAPSEAFWKLPSDADSASFAVGTDPKRFDAIRRSAADLLDGWLEHEKVPKKVRDDLVDLVEEAFKSEGASVFASGSLPQEAAKPKTSAEEGRAMVRGLIGWNVAAIKDKPDNYKKFLANVMRSYNDAQFRKMLQTKLQVDPKDLPKLTTRGARGLPAGSVVYELSVPDTLFDESMPPAIATPVPAPGRKPPPAPKPVRPAPGKPIQFVLIIVPQGDTTWLGFSVDEKLLTQKLTQAMKGTAAQGLGSRSGLTSLKNASGVSGGFFTLGSFMSGMQGWLSRSVGDNSAAVLASMPNKGASPMPYLLSVKAEGKGVVADWKLTVPKEVLADIAGAVPAMAGSMMMPMGPPPTAPPPPPAPPRPSRPRP